MDVELNLHTETVRDAEHAEALIVSPETSLREALVTMKESNRGSVLICRDDELLGVFTERDALQIMAKGEDLESPVERFMVAPVVTVRDGDTMAMAITKMFSGGFRRLPIVDDERRPIGDLRISAVLDYLVQHFPQSVYNLPPNPGSVPQEREGP